MTPFKAVAYRSTLKKLPEIIGTYSISLVQMQPQMNQLLDYLHYSRQANQISYQASIPRVNDGYLFRKIAGTSTIDFKLVDIMGNESSYEMKFTLIVPVVFISDLPDMSIVLGEPSSFALPEILVEEGYQLKKVIVQPKEY